MMAPELSAYKLSGVPAYGVHTHVYKMRFPTVMILQLNMS